MKKSFVLIIATIILALAAFLVYKYSGRGGTTVFNESQTNQTNTTTPMIITSPAFLHNEGIRNQYVADADGFIKPREYKNLPAETKSLALIVEHHDAPMGTWYHWVM